MVGVLLLCVISVYGQVEEGNRKCLSGPCVQPILTDSHLKVDLLFQGNFSFESNNISPVSTMTFLNSGEILLLNKNNGIVYKVLGNALSSQPLLDVNVSNKRERGLVGIETSIVDNAQYVYLYYTESERSDGSDICPAKWYSESHHCNPEFEPVGNRLYKYELKNDKLTNPKLLLDLPASPSPTHNGGVIRVGPDNNLYLTIGDLLGDTYIKTSTKAQNFNHTEPDGRSGILRITQEGKTVGSGILGSSDPLNKYFAYGIRNSFGIDFDPVTGNLWDTENGPEYGDEINLVMPGFNSGWDVVQGIWEPIVNVIEDTDLIAGKKLLNSTDKLQDFEGKGHYSEPEFIWKFTVGPTAAKFLNSDKLGKTYESDLFIACSSGMIFHFDLNNDRTKLRLHGPLKDKIAENTDELKDIIFAQGFGLITDLDVGPDGYMYVLSNYQGKPTIFRIASISN